MNLVKLISFLSLFTTGALAQPSIHNHSSAVTNPFVYQRLRFDKNFLQIYRRFQKHLKLDENKISIKFNDSTLSDHGRNDGHIKSLEYYENREIELTSIDQDDLIFEALDRAYLTRLIPVFIQNYDNEQDRAKASDPKLVSRERCDRELDFLMNQLDIVQRARFSSRARINLSPQMSPELMVFFDSFANEEPGLLLGNYHWPGNGHQCNKRKIFSLERSNVTVSLEFKGRHCLASIRSPRWDTRIKQRIIELERQKHFKYDQQRYDYARFFRIQIGICFPESCNSQTIKWRSDDIHKLATFKLSEPLRSYQLTDLYCFPDETSELRKLEPSGRAFVYLIIVWCLLVMVCSIYDARLCNDISKPQSNLEKFVHSLSLFRNFNRLVETVSCQKPLPTAKNDTNEDTIETKSRTQSKKALKSSNPKELHPNDLLFLNAIKVISMPMIIFGHVGMLFKHLDRYALDYDGLDSDFVFHFQASTPFFVDWYFVISGFLTTYLTFVTHKVERNSIVQWAYGIFHRYWRLAPLYILLFWFSQSVFMYTSSGPQWDYGTSNMTLRAICRRESFLWPITLTSNLHPLHEECIMPAWYIACDMQFYLITPFILILLFKSPLMGWLICLGSIGACISLRLHRYLTDDRAQPLELMRPRYDLYMRNNWDMHPTYVYPQYRIATYLIGILAGHYTYMVLSGKWTSIIYAPQAIEDQNKSTMMRARFAPILRLAACLYGFQQLIAMMFATWLISDMFPLKWEQHVKYFTALIYSFDHAATGLGMALLLVTLMLGQFKRLRHLMSHPYWTVLSRVNFIVYLTQVEWIYWLIQSDQQTVPMSKLEIFKIFIYLSFFVYLFASICAVLLELPLAQLERNFIGVLFVSLNKKNAKKSDIVAHVSGRKSDREMTSRNIEASDDQELSRLVNSQRAKQFENNH